MARVLAVAFERYGRLHYLDPGPHEVAVGDAVLVPTEHGPEVARCVWLAGDVAWDDRPLPVCAGPASADDLERDALHRRRRAEILVVAEELIDRHDLAMKAVAVDYLDRNVESDHLCVVYFKAAPRVDFRALLSDLARALQSRIDLRQVGARDVAALTGGVGGCGREYCCAVMAPAADPVSLRLARSQDLPSNPLQIAGACGRMLCCLAYEHRMYVDFLDRAPAVGKPVETPAGRGIVTGHSVPAEAVWVRTADGLQSCPLEQACPLAEGRARGPRIAIPALGRRERRPREPRQGHGLRP